MDDDTFDAGGGPCSRSETIAAVRSSPDLATAAILCLGLANALPPSQADLAALADACGRALLDLVGRLDHYAPPS